MNVSVRAETLDAYRRHYPDECRSLSMIATIFEFTFDPAKPNHGATQ